MSATRVACRPIHTLAALNEWEPSKEQLDELTRSSVPLLPDRTEAAATSGKQKVLICHDMAGALPNLPGHRAAQHAHRPRCFDRLLPVAWAAVQPATVHRSTGGYYEDKWAQGSTSSDTYLFEFWQCVDTFIYFAHVLVTIPPVGWINAAHQNRAKLLGTFILEWEAGAEVCKELFHSRESADHAAKQLARIAQWFGFEGWLVWH